MTVRRSRIISVLCALLLIAAVSSCVKVRGPGLLPPIEDKGGNQWKVLNTEFLMVQTNTGAKQWQWQIIARFMPGTEDEGLKPLDIFASVDGVQVPFTFEEDGQVFESVTSAALIPGMHKFELKPSENTSRPFPTLMVEFEAP